MDPNETLKLIRERIRDMDKRHDEDDAYWLAEDIAALDNWLCRKGFLPKDWER